MTITKNVSEFVIVIVLGNEDRTMEWETGTIEWLRNINNLRWNKACMTKTGKLQMLLHSLYEMYVDV